jgi:hypothetical protein
MSSETLSVKPSSEKLVKDIRRVFAPDVRSKRMVAGSRGRVRSGSEGPPD